MYRLPAFWALFGMLMLAGPCLAEPLRGRLVEAGRAPNVLGKPPINLHISPNEVLGGAPETNRKIVGIYYDDDAGMPRVCSGLWISQRFILTAAHCTCDNASRKFRVSNDDAVKRDWRPATLHVRFRNSFCQTRQPQQGDDLALLVLDSPLPPQSMRNQYTCEGYSLLGNIKLAGNWLRNPPARIKVAGYGFDGDNVSSLGKRRSAFVRVNTLTCAQPLAQSLGCSPLSEIILGAGVTDGAYRDTCAGDSGGPAYIEDDKGEFLPIGIVSRGLPVTPPYPHAGVCGAGGIYTLLGRNSVIEWLRRSGVPAGLSRC